MKVLIMKKSEITLELNIIINEIKERVRLLENKTLLDNYVPFNDFEEIQQALNEVDEASILLQRMNRFPLYFQGDIRFILKMVQKGRNLSVE